MAKRLKAQNISYLILEHDLKLVREAKELNEPIFFGNAAQKTILEAVNIKNSIAVIVAVANEDKLRLISEAISSLKNNINIVVKVRNQDEKNLLDDLKIDHIVVSGEEIANILVKEALLCKIL